MDHYQWHATRCSRDPIFAKKSDKRFLVKKINKVKEDLKKGTTVQGARLIQETRLDIK